MRFLMFAAALALVSSPARAEPVYLVCSLADAKGEGRITLDVTVNEDRGKAGFVIKQTGWSLQGLDAAFTPTTVTWVTTRGAVTTQFSIDRTTLQMVMRSQVAGPPLERAGKCDLAPKIDRQF